MDILVEHKDLSGLVTNQTHRMSKLALVKHLAIAGQGYAPSSHKILKTIGIFLHYVYYIQRNDYNNNKFSEPPTNLSDPTEKGQFSNLAGKAIADFLSKRIDNSIFTVNYESAMRLNGYTLSGQRPDLLAYSQTSMFAIEAKGRHQNNSGNMSAHKAQSQSGPIKVNFSVACVSYDLFNQVKCKYHDPYNDNVPFDNDSLRTLSRNYYKSFEEFLNDKYFVYEDLRFNNEDFYKIALSYRNFERLLPKEFPITPVTFRKLVDYYRPSLILPRRIHEFAEEGISNENKPFKSEAIQESNMYIDNDRIGLRIR